MTITAEDVVRAAMNAEKAGNTKARDALLAQARTMMGQATPAAPVADAPMAPPAPVIGPDGKQVLYGKRPGEEPDVIGDTTGKVMAPSIAMAGRFLGGLTGQSQSPTGALLPERLPGIVRAPVAAVGDLGGLALSGLATGISTGAGLLAEAIPQSRSNEERLAQDLIGASQFVAPELAGVSSAVQGGVKAAQRAARPLTEAEAAREAMGNLGVNPSLGMRGKTGATIAAGLEQVPFANTVIARDAARAVEEVEGALARVTAPLGKALSPEGAGGVMQSGLKATVEAFKTRAGELFGKVDARIPKGARFKADSTVAAVAKTKAAFAENPKLAEMLGLNKWDAVVAEAGERGVPWDALSEWRSSVGRAIGSLKGELTDQDAGRLKLLYGALTEDMEAAAKMSGNGAYGAWKAATNYYAYGAQKIERSLDETISAKSPERAFEAFANIAKKDRASSDLTRLREIKSAMKDDDWNAVAASIVDRLGKSRPGQQNADGDAFSPATFLTEWNKLDPQAKAILLPKDTRDALEEFARVAGAVKNAEKSRNTSNTAGANNLAKTAIGLSVAPVETATALAGTYLTARALTSTTFLNAATAGMRGATRPLEAMAKGEGPFAADARSLLSTMAGQTANTDAPLPRAVNQR